MFSSTKSLPDGYCQTAEINLATNKVLSILLSLAALILFFPSLVLVGSFVLWARPDFSAFTLGIAGLLGFLVSFPLTMLVHELIHGIFFWIFTRSKPVFALRLLYAYAAAPDWFIPARSYWIIGMAPLVLIAAIGLLLISVAPPGWIPFLGFSIAMNTAGAVGDMYIVARLLRLSRGSLVKDAGDRISFYEPAPPISTSA